MPNVPPVVGARSIERWLIAPRIPGALRASRRALPFRSGGQAPFLPGAVRGCFEPTDPGHRPVGELRLRLPTLRLGELGEAFQPVSRRPILVDELRELLHGHGKAPDAEPFQL